MPRPVPPLRLLHVVPTYLPAVRYGGPIVSVHGLARALARRGHEVQVYTTSVDGPADSAVPHEQPVDVDGVRVWYFRSRRLRRIYRAPTMARALEARCAEFDVVHLHSVFLWPTLAAARAAQRARVPYLVSPRGMLVRDLVRARSRAAKTLWIALFERRTLARAAAVHVTSEVEARELEALCPGLGPLEVVPNGVDPGPARLAADTEAWVRGVSGGRPFVLALGRVSWKKGLDRLIEALARVPALALVVAGPDEEGLTPVLARGAARHRVSARVAFLGPVRGERKRGLLARCLALVLPSRSESFGNVVLEAMAAGRPVVVTPEVGLADAVAAHDAGLVVAPGPEAIAAALARLATAPDAARDMGARGRRLAERVYGWDAVAARMEEIYARVAAPGAARRGAR